MRTRFALGGAVLMAVAVWSAANVAGQLAGAARTAASRDVARMPDGHPDLQGTYDLATLTPLERAADTPLVLTEEQAAKLERQVADRNVASDAPIDANRT